MREEKTYDYIWALNQFLKHLSNVPFVIVTDRELALMSALESVFPSTKNFLCVWHINKNILANCKKEFQQEIMEWERSMSDWSVCTESCTVEEFESNWNLFDQRWSVNHLHAVSYISKTWIMYKEKFIRAFTDQHLHLGCRTTSRGEISHYAMKHYVNLAKCNLLTVHEKINLMLDTQFTEIATTIESQKCKITHSHQLPIFCNLLGKVSQFGLNKILFQYRQCETDSHCTSLFTKTFGLPCKHIIKQYKVNCKPLELELIHPQWLLNQSCVIIEQLQPSPKSPLTETINQLNQTFHSLSKGQQEILSLKVCETLSNPVPELKDPLIVTRKRGRPSITKSKSIKRDRVLFEHAEISINGYMCSNCGQRGHNIRTCPNKRP